MRLYCSLHQAALNIVKKCPDFDSRNYGFGKLIDFTKSLPRFARQRK